ncbi:MAG: YjgP/YjgQ family permease [Waddliaceae bacterium]|jgi:lipopolysaccharide export system permease protein|nr:YjgP/YjgQ family permease [Waddliaceae bacterium]MBT3579115.1 YjgP/YjgQ family permease [Waddliaceae bacterium]MBT4444908.1 YjgP/YjgQ family permease [Waddliaceae bacterium]MBT6927939.1 YjgP/YjgQ family permease [Waddliaceae bacterium]MBT7264805.1 YjgP/YjgQ family permease [Waddliaceae bacterium]
MIFSKIWERYVLKEILKIFFFFLAAFYLLFIFIDYSTHTKSFFLFDTPLKELVQYYLYQFSYRVPILIPFAIVLAVIKVLCSLNVNRELLALQAGGISIKMLMRPFFFVAVIFMLSLFFNYEYIIPKATLHLQVFEDDYFNDPADKKKLALSVNDLILPDNSKIIYQNYDPAHQRFYDVYWVRSSSDIYRIKHLLPYEATPRGYNVSHFTGDDGFITQEERFLEMLFPDMHFDEEDLRSSVIPYKEQSISQLFIADAEDKASPEKKAQIKTALFLKLAMPLMCILAVIGPAPFCIRFRRDLPVFFIYTLGIFGILGFKTIIDAGFVFGDNMVVSPLIAIWGPVIATLAFFSRKYFIAR